jgi:hypothetical protein
MIPLQSSSNINFTNSKTPDKFISPYYQKRIGHSKSRATKSEISRNL